MKNPIYQVVSVLAIMGYFVPMLIVLLKKLWKVIPFLLFALYWLANGLINVLLLIPGLNRTFIENLTVVYNMLDMPIILSIIHFSTSSVQIRWFTRVAVPFFVALELVNSLFLGVNADALKYPLAVGLLIVLPAIIWEIVLYLQKVQHTGKEKALLLIYCALLFEYGTYIVIYIFDYYLQKISSVVDNYVFYYISSVIALMIAISGYMTKGINKKSRFLEPG